VSSLLPHAPNNDPAARTSDKAIPILRFFMVLTPYEYGLI
jgi:hypothetical protein